MNTIKNFLNNYAKVFDDNDKVKWCGRQACIDLIESCHYVPNSKTYGYYGSIETGLMNIPHIQELRDSVLEVEKIG